MLQEQTPAPEVIISEQVIQEQIQKIFSFHPFTVSAVLRNFLTYIVNETISGRSNDIKEYNIAVDVLGRPAAFRTVHSGIVRVHARRLRRALHLYYREQGVNDPCVITIPTGRYVPVFKNAETDVSVFLPELRSVNQLHSDEKIKIAVMPFHCFELDLHRMAFADSIGFMLSESLGSFPDISLISYFTMQQINKKSGGIQSLVSAFEIAYVLTGNVHFEGPKIRVNFQLVQAPTETQIYSETYCLNFSSGHYFDLSDQIVSRVLTTLGQFNGWSGQPCIKNLPEVPFRTTGKGEKFSFSTDKRLRRAIAG
jgi:TolB-like protein